jgi:hypothetical protein
LRWWSVFGAKQNMILRAVGRLTLEFGTGCRGTKPLQACLNGETIVIERR